MGDPWQYLVWLGILTTTFCLSDGNLYHEQFDKSVEAFLLDNGYFGGALAAMKDGHIIYAKGYGVDSDGFEIKDTSLFPVSSISQSITAVAILKLAEIGALDLDRNVFGSGGYLHMLKPFRTETVDPRLNDITVRHLLQHSGGWDMNQGPLYDPMLNPYYLRKGLDVPDISKIMDLSPPLTYFDTIEYVISQKLDFTPGTKSVYSNLGYTILGRVIEEIADIAYEDFVKENILKPCGMWHTRIGSKEKIEEMEMNMGLPISVEDDEEITVYDVIHPTVLDSTLGWYSTVFDMLRFSRCIEDHVGSGLLEKESIQEITRKPVAVAVQHSSSWYGAGFRVSNHGSIWQDAEKHTNDVLLFQSHKHEFELLMPDSWVFLLHGNKNAHLKHKAHDLMEYLGLKYDKDEFLLHDLSDVQLLTTAIKYELDEHHLSAYVNALKLENYDVTWISGHEAYLNTKFTVIAEKSSSHKDYLVEHGFTEKTLFTRKLELEAIGYNMTFLQNYKSYSHDEQFAFLAIFRKDGFDKQTHMKWGIHHYPRPYSKLLGLYVEKGYYPAVESYIHHRDESLISFMFLKRDQERKVHFEEHHGLSVPALEKMVSHQANKNRKLAYLDVTITYRKPRFSAVFTNQDPGGWIFVAELLRHQVDNFIYEKFSEGYRPSKIVGYTRTGKNVKYAVYMEKVKTDNSDVEKIDDFDIE